MSASEFRIPMQHVTPSQTAESAVQFKVCRCGKGDNNIWTTKTSENSDKQPSNCSNCQVLKSGHLLISSRGIGWTSWKKRWFILTRASLVFFRSDPNVPLPRGGEPNVTLGGIDLNSSGSVVVKEDKKLLTVLFPDGRDGRTFTLKAENSEDLNEWKTALENALAQAPSAAHVMGQNAIFRADTTDPVEVSVDLPKDREPIKSVAVGRPVLLALEDIDGSPSFLEKALRFIEEYGIKVEGILRQSADVEEVKCRVRDYEKGKDEFSPEEDAHVVGDCIKFVLREMPSSPVPASCCTALVEAFRTDRAGRLNAMHAAIYETFPEPNRRLLLRILKMMRTVATHKAVNRMSQSALAACMAPLLLRPLLAGDCELDGDFSMGGDGSLQLLQAAAAANHAQAIVIILLEEYERIFDETLLQDGSCSSVYTESEGGDVDKEYSTDNDNPEDDGSYDDANDELEADLDEDTDHSSGGTFSEHDSDIGSDVSDDKALEIKTSKVAYDNNNQAVQPPAKAGRIEQAPSWEKSDQISSTSHTSFPMDVAQEEDVLQKGNNNLYPPTQESYDSNGKVSVSLDQMLETSTLSLPSRTSKFIQKSSEHMRSSKRPTVWGRTSARKNLSMEEIDYCSDDENRIVIQKLESTKSDLQTKIAKEVKENANLQASLERRKEALHERRLALEKDVEKLREQLQKERNLRASLESGLMNMRRGQVSFPPAIDSKTRADLEEVALAEADIFNLKQRVADLRGQINNQLQPISAALCESCNKRLHIKDEAVKKDQEDINEVTPLQQRENLSKCEVDLEQLRKQTLHSFSSTSKPPLQKQQLNTTYQCSITSSGGNSVQSTEERCTVNKGSVSSVDKQHPEKQQTSAAHLSSTKSLSSEGVASTEQLATASQIGAPRSSSKGQHVKKEDQEGTSSSRWNFSRKQYSSASQASKPQRSSSISSSDEPSSDCSATLKRISSKTEEPGSMSTSSALAKLTSRLNFLKERRAQLASEMQNLDLSRTVGPAGPPPRTNS